MKLTDTSDYQQDDSQTWLAPRISFTFSARSKSGTELIEKDITYSYAEALDEWSLFHYKERRCRDVSEVSARNWRTVHDVHWDKAHLIDADVDVPESVVEHLDEMIGLDVVKIRE